MYKKLLFLFFFAAVCVQGFSQTINLIFPKIPSAEAWIYTFTGSSVDSSRVVLDKQGKASFTLPQKNYRGIVYLYIPKRGGGEFIVAEPNITVTTDEERFNANSLIFPHSQENEFLRYIFERRNFLSQKQEWLMSSSLFIDRSNPLYEPLQTMQSENTRAFDQFNDSIKNSKLYAAQYSRLMLFMQNLYAVVQNYDAAQKQALQREMETSLPIDALYHAGNLWINVHEYYLTLFMNYMDKSVAQKAYSQSIIVTLQRLQEPVASAFMQSALVAAERGNLQTAIALLANYVQEKKPAMITQNATIQRIVQANALQQGSKAPQIVGLQTPLTTAALVVFFESDCGHCRHELEILAKHAAAIQAQGYRIISISADRDVKTHNAMAQTFTWDKADQLCDLKGFDGVNFTNFSVAATPTFFSISPDGVITGKYAQTEEFLQTLPKK
ncbi:MAG: redoxin domain-containing protein [Bacteroidales bacterium]|jgi:peroxiredoxin|nr:redoxin domain-containing protein [Bacteroidales bacterium]